MKKAILPLTLLVVVAGGLGVFAVLGRWGSETVEIPGGTASSPAAPAEKGARRPAGGGGWEAPGTSASPAAGASKGPEGESGKDGLTVRGILRDEFGVPLSGVRVVIVPPWDFGGKLPRAEDVFSIVQKSLPGPGRWPSTLSDADGSFEYSVEKAGAYHLLTGPPDFTETWKTVRLTPEGPVQTVELILKRGLSVQGRVVESEGGVPVEGITVTAKQAPGNGHAYKGQRFRSCRTGPDGVFTLAGFEPGSVVLDVLVPKDRPFEREWSAIRRFEAGRRDIELKLTGVGFVEFQAFEEGTRNPIDIPIQVLLTGASRWKFRPSVTKKEPGLFVLKGYGPYTEYLLKAGDFTPIRVRFDVPPGDRTVHPTPIIFSRGGRVTGTVSLVEGKIGPGAFVYYNRIEPDESPNRFVNVSANGEFRIAGLTPGRYRLLALAPGNRPGRAEVRVGVEEVRRDFLLQPRLPGDPPAPASHPFAKRKDIKVSLAMIDLPFREMIDWLREISGADVTLREGIEFDEDEFRVQLQVEDLPLSTALKLITTMQGLKLDEETGEIYRED